MWHHLDIDRLAKILLPPILLRPIQLLWVQLLLFPIKYINGYFATYRSEINKQLKYNGQIIVLENILNDKFDLNLRRIYILTDGSLQTQLYIYQSSENKSEPLFIKGTGEPLYLFQSTESLTVSFDFTVYVPDGILDTEAEKLLKYTLNRWKMDGKRARFQYFSGLNF